MSDSVAVSVVTPVYNVEPYLRQCLDSLCAQDLPNIEFICVNDGSTDGSAAILHEYAQRDARIRVIDKPNSGYGATMNRGIAEARGEYIGIVESDDFAEPTMFRELYRAAKKRDCDLVKCNYFEYYDGADHVLRNFGRLMCGRRFDPADKPQIIRTIPAIWTGLYRRSMLVEQEVGFRETPGASFQDTGFTLKAWFAARSCVLLRKPLLHYRMDNPSSSSVSISEKPFTVVDELASAEAFLRTMPDRAARFLPWFYADKFGKYRWCYERVPAEAKVRFAKIVRDEYAAAEAAGELDVALFTQEEQAVLREMLASTPEEFAENHFARF